MTWHQEVTNAAPRVSPIVDLTLDDASVLRAIDNLNFIQMKRKYFGFLWDWMKFCNKVVMQTIFMKYYDCKFVLTVRFFQSVSKNYFLQSLQT